MRTGERAAAVVAVTAVAIALPTLVARFPPMTDLPLHAETVGLLRHFGDPAFVPPGLYERNFGHPNQLFHLLAWALSYPFGVDGGCKLVVAASQVAIVLGGLRLARHVGASPWCALLFAPLALGWTYRFGLVANLLGLGLFFAALPSLDDATTSPRPASAARSCAWMLLLYAAHESVLVIAALTVGLFTAAHGRRGGLRAVALRLTPAVFAAVIVAVQLTVQRATFARSGASDGGVIWRSPLQNLLELPYTLTGLPDLAVSGALAALTALAVVSFASGLGRRAGAAKAGSAFVHHRWLVAGVLFLVASLVFPFGFAHGTAFHQRFFGPALGLVVVGLAAGTRSSPARRSSVLLAGAVPLAFFLVAVPELLDADRQNRALDSLLEQVQPGSAVAAIEADRDKGGRAYAIVSMAARVAALRGGRTTVSFNESVIAPVLLRPEHQWPESAARLANNTVDFEPERDFALYRYALVHSRNPAIQAIAPEVMAPEARMLGQAGEWQLFEATGPVIPSTAPEPPPPAGDLETFRIRAITALARLGRRGR